jgi:hypothetical protein
VVWCVGVEAPRAEWWKGCSCAPRMHGFFRLGLVLVLVTVVGGLSVVAFGGVGVGWLCVGANRFVVWCVCVIDSSLALNE